MSKIIKTTLASLLVVSAVAHSEPATSEKQANQAVKYRQALLQLVRSNVGALGAMAKGQIPVDATLVEKNAMRIEQLSLMMDDYFALDTSAFTLDTSAEAKIWTESDKFSEKVQVLQSASSELKSLAASGDADKIKAGIGNVLKSCKGCHDIYKAD